MKSRKPLLLVVLVLALLVALLILPGVTSRAGEAKPDADAYATWQESAANLDLEENCATWSAEVRQLSEDEAVGWEVMHVIKNDGCWPLGHYMTSDLVSLEFKTIENDPPAHDHCVAEAVFVWKLGFLPMPIYHKVELIDRGGDGQNQAAIYSGFDPASLSFPLIPPHPADVEVVMQ